MLTWHSFLKKRAGECRNDGFGVRGWLMAAWSITCVFCGSGVDGKKLFRIVFMFLAVGDANEYERALTGDIRAGPVVDVGPTLKDGLSVSVRYQGFSESKWCETVKAKREEAHDPGLDLDGTEEGLNLRDAARGYAVK